MFTEGKGRPRRGGRSEPVHGSVPTGIVNEIVDAVPKESGRDGAVVDRPRGVLVHALRLLSGSGVLLTPPGLRPVGVSGVRGRGQRHGAGVPRVTRLVAVSRVVEEYVLDVTSLSVRVTVPLLLLVGLGLLAAALIGRLGKWACLLPGLLLPVIGAIERRPVLQAGTEHTTRQLLSSVSSLANDLGHGFASRTLPVAHEPNQRVLGIRLRPSAEAVMRLGVVVGF